MNGSLSNVGWPTKQHNGRHTIAGGMDLISEGACRCKLTPFMTVGDYMTIYLSPNIVISRTNISAAIYTNSG